MNFPNVIRTECIPTEPPAPDPRCSDPAFALAHPDICVSVPILVIKPGVLLVCTLGSVQFRVFVDKNGTEEEITEDVIFSTSDPDTAVIGAISGNATGVEPGVVTITATYGELTATARLTVLAGTNNCCDELRVATILVVDTSKSMSLGFGGAYSNKMAFARAVASQYAGGINAQKDTIGLVTFANTPTTNEALTDVVADVQTAAGLLVAGVSLTGIGLALAHAATLLDASDADLKTIVLITDGEDKDAVVADEPVAIASTFKNNGGIILCVGVRAHDTGFNLLNAIATGGFFVNAYPAVVDDALDAVLGLKGYLCDGNCTPVGDEFTATPALDFDGFTKWDVTEGHVDLIGDGLYDLLPGNGMYLDMAGSSSPFAGTITSKDEFDFESGKTYRISFYLAGNQRQDLAGQKLLIQLGDGTAFTREVAMPDYTQDFTQFSFNFTLPADLTAKLSFVQSVTSDSFYGLLLDQILLENVTDLITMLSDNFDSENLVYVPPRCGASVELPGYYGYDCYGEGCSSSPLGVQIQDPNPLGDIEADYVPPNTYTATKSFTATCPSGSVQVNDESAVPVMTSATAPSGIVTTNSETANHEAWRVFGGSGGWNTVAGTQQPQVGYEFDDAKTIVSFSITSPNPLAGVLLIVYGDGNIIFNQPLNLTPGSKSTFIVTSPGSYSAYLFKFLANIPNNQVMDVTLLELFEGTGTGGITRSATETSQISQADADAKATAAAQEAAYADLMCATRYTSTQSFTASCPAGQYGLNVTRNATATSLVSQADAIALALEEAREAAEAALVCTLSNNDQQIVIRDSDNNPVSAVPYPSVKYVSGKTGLVTLVTVTLLGFEHDWPADAQIFLRSPSGRKVKLMQNVGGSTPAGPIDLTFADSGATLVQGNPLVAGTYKPAQFLTGSTFPFPAPAGPYAATMNEFLGDTPNGSWSLWVVDIKPLDTGVISGGWTIDIQTA